MEHGVGRITLRAWQQRELDRAARALAEDKIVCVNAPTGSGKTLFSLLAWRESGVPRLVALTRTNTQVNSFIRDVNKFLPGTRMGVLVGKQKLCIMAEQDVEPDEIECKTCPYRAMFKPWFAMQTLEQTIHFAPICKYLSMRAGCAVADVCSMSYPYLFNEAIREASGLIRGNEVIVIDEAHNIDSSVADIFERALTPVTLERAAAQAERFGSQEAKHTFLELKSWLEQLVKDNSSQDRLVLYDKDQLGDQIKVAADYGARLGLMLLEEMRRARRYTKNYLLSVAKFYELLASDNIQTFLNGHGIVAKLLDPAPLLEPLHNTPAILMSGTLPNAEYIQRVWGLANIEYIDVPWSDIWPEKPFSFHVDGEVTSKYEQRNDQMFHAYAQKISQIYRNSDGDVLVMFPSYTIAKKVIELCNITKPKPILETRRMHLQDVVSKLRQTKSNVLIAAVAGGKLLEGVEFVDQDGSSMVKTVVIAGIPYPVPDDLHRLRSHKIMSRLGETEKEFYYMSFIPAWIKVRQAIGRAVRTPKDRAKIYLLDSRFQKWIGKWL